MESAEVKENASQSGSENLESSYSEVESKRDIFFEGFCHIFCHEYTRLTTLNILFVTINLLILHICFAFTFLK